MTQTELRYAHHPDDVKHYDTTKLREHFLADTIFQEGKITLIYTMYDRYVVGGAVPVNTSLLLEALDEFKSSYFLERRELGIINLGETGTVKVDGTAYELNKKEALYVGQGAKEVIFEKSGEGQPIFYINSAPAHHAYPTVKVTKENAEIVELGDSKTSNRRTINKLIVNSVVPTCQLQMGLTELHEGSVWNTMPAHTHNRRMEAYCYFDVPEGQAVCHFMGQPNETRHIFMQNLQAVISPEWSIHSGCGTSNYSFVWGMAGENLDYGDMDTVAPNALK
nr:5-dehydro-4-deoxy-D-glucuronate isomerase [uncultured Flavobacterium sp.]